MTEHSRRYVGNGSLGSTATGLNAFVQTARTGSFAKAARAMGMTASGVSKAVQRLEDRLDIPLFVRTTRTVTITEEGSRFLPHAERIAIAAIEADVALSSLTDTPAGRLRVSIAPGFGQMVVLGSLAAFRARYPEVMLDIDVSSRAVDVAAEGFDIVLRTARALDTALIGRWLTEIRAHLCASPGYLAAHPIGSVDDLTCHACIRYRPPTTGMVEGWPLRKAIALPETVVLNDPTAVLAAAVDGVGIALVPEYAAQPLVARKALSYIYNIELEDKAPIEAWLLWPAQRRDYQALRVFVDHVVAVVATMPGSRQAIGSRDAGQFRQMAVAGLCPVTDNDDANDTGLPIGSDATASTDN